MSHPFPVVLVTGSATGVGRACAVGFARQGFDVVINYSKSEAEAREAAALVEATGQRSLTVACDISDEAAVLTDAVDCSTRSHGIRLRSDY